MTPTRSKIEYPTMLGFFSKSELKSISDEIHRTMTVLNKPDNIFIKQIHEDALTGLILKNITKILSERKSPSIDFVIKSLFIHEKKTGRDFDLWIGKNNNQYIRLCCQCKNFGNNTSEDDDYEIDKLQCDTLINFSRNPIDSTIDKIHKKYIGTPVYLFFQYLPHLRNKSIVITHAENVKRKINQTDEKMNKLKISFNELHNFGHSKIFNILSENSYLFYELAKIDLIKNFERSIDRLNPTAFILLLLLLGQEDNYKENYLHRITKEKILKLYNEKEQDEGTLPKHVIILNNNKLGNTYNFFDRLKIFFNKINIYN